MDLRQIRYFVAVAEELNITKAAARLNMAQPPLSQQMRMLEEELGVVLLERGSRPLKLTEAGHLLLNEGRAILAKTEAVVSDVRRVGRGLSGKLAVGFVGSAMYTIVAECLREFRDTWPDVELSLYELLAPEIKDAIHEQRIDVGFSRPPIGASEEIGQEIVVREPYALMVPGEHQFAKRSSIRLVDLDKQPLIIHAHPSPNVGQSILSALNQAGIDVNIVQEVRHLQTAVGLVAAGVGVAFSPLSVCERSNGAIHYVPIEENSLAADLGMSWRYANPSPALRHFLSKVRRHVRIGVENLAGIG